MISFFNCGRDYNKNEMDNQTTFILNTHCMNNKHGISLDINMNKLQHHINYAYKKILKKSYQLQDEFLPKKDFANNSRFFLKF